jgi:16S rRNA (cytosine967-C5)-methyltransferase
VAVLRDIERRRGFSNRILSEHLERDASMDARDRGLVTHLVYGVLRHRTRLDRQIDARATKPGGIKGEVRELLRVGALELRELGHPPHAAVSEAVRAAQRLAGGGRLRGLIHAVLQGVAEHGAALDDELAAADPVEALTARWSIPAWLATRWVAQLGADAALRRAVALSTPPPIDLRVDLHRTTRDAVCARLEGDHPRAEVEAPAAHPQALRVRRAGDLAYGPLHGEGLVSVQGLAAQQAAIWLAPQAGMRVLDACAGMGTKTQQLAEIMGRRGTIVAADSSEERLEQHEEAARRGSLAVDGLSVHVARGDLTGDVEAVDAGGPYDAVLLDVPCTGLGNLARHPEIRWSRTAADIADRAPLQRALLERCLGRVAPGGRLVYAVCSFAPEEGAQLVGPVAAAAGATVVRERTYTPEDDGTEGFHLAEVRR